MKNNIIVPDSLVLDIMCVYRFTLDSGHFYIGSSQNLKKRIAGHKKNFCSSKINSKETNLISSSKNIVFEIIEIVNDFSLLRIREDVYLKKYWGCPLLLNRAEDAVVGGYRKTEEEKESIRKAATGRKFPQYVKDKMSESMKKKYKDNPDLLLNNKKKAMEKAVKVIAYKADGTVVKKFDSIQDTSRGLNIPARTVQNILRGVQVTVKGYYFRKLSANGLELIPPPCKKFKPNNSPVRVEQYNLSGILLNTFGSIGQASRETGVHLMAIHNVFAGKQKSANGYVFKRY